MDQKGVVIFWPWRGGPGRDYKNRNVSRETILIQLYMSSIPLMEILSYPWDQ
jgi:hypothetical protein